MKTNEEIESSRNVNSDYNRDFAALAKAGAAVVLRIMTAVAKAGVAVVLCIIAMVCCYLITFGSFFTLILLVIPVCSLPPDTLSGQLGVVPCLLFRFSVVMLISLLLFMLLKTCKTIALQLFRGESLTLGPVFHRFSRSCMLFCLSFMGCYITFFCSTIIYEVFLKNAKYVLVYAFLQFLEFAAWLDV